MTTVPRDSSPLVDPGSSLLPRESSRNRAAKGIESARGPLFEPDAKRIEPDTKGIEPPHQWTRAGSSLVTPRLESTRLETTLNSKDSSPLGSCTTLILFSFSIAHWARSSMSTTCPLSCAHASRMTLLDPRRSSLCMVLAS